MQYSTNRIVNNRIRFERNASRVVFDPDAMVFVVTWSKCNLPIKDRLAARKDPLVWIPSILAITTLYDRGCINHDRILYAAIAIRRAWDAGDRELLDTEEAKKAAELVRDLPVMCTDSSSPSVSIDIGHAIRRLTDEIASVRFSNADISPESAERSIESADKAYQCLSRIQGFRSWEPRSLRKRFLYCLNRDELSDIVYTLASLLFDTGSCPLLSLSDRRIIRMNALKQSGLMLDVSPENIHSFFKCVMDIFVSMRENGLSKFSTRVTQQQLVDSFKLS